MPRLAMMKYRVPGQKILFFTKVTLKDRISKIAQSIPRLIEVKGAKTNANA